MFGYLHTIFNVFFPKPFIYIAVRIYYAFDNWRYTSYCMPGDKDICFNFYKGPVAEYVSIGKNNIPYIDYPEKNFIPIKEKYRDITFYWGTDNPCELYLKAVEGPINSPGAINQICPDMKSITPTLDLVVLPPHWRHYSTAENICGIPKDQINPLWKEQLGFTDKLHERDNISAWRPLNSFHVSGEHTFGPGYFCPAGDGPCQKLLPE